MFQQEEAIPENLKNIILVMADGGHLVSPTQDPSKEQIWSETKKRLGRFLPTLFVEIFPDDTAAQEKSAPVSGISSPILTPTTEKPGGEQEPPGGDAEAGGAEVGSQDGDEGKPGPDTRVEPEAGEAGKGEGNGNNGNGEDKSEGEEKAEKADA